MHSKFVDSTDPAPDRLSGSDEMNPRPVRLNRHTEQKLAQVAQVAATTVGAPHARLLVRLGSERPRTIAHGTGDLRTALDDHLVNELTALLSTSPGNPSNVARRATGHAIVDHQAYDWAACLIDVDTRIAGALVVLAREPWSIKKNGWLVLESFARLAGHELERAGQQSDPVAVESRAAHADTEALMLRVAREGLAEIDRDGRCLFMNQAAAEMLRVDADRLLGSGLHDCVHARRPDGTQCEPGTCPLLAYRQGTRVEVDEDLFWRPDGSSFPVEYSVVPVIDSAGQVTGGILRFTDQTEHRRTENALRQHEEHYRTFLEMTLDPIIMLDQDGRIIEFNPAAERAFGHAAERVLGSPMIDLLIPPPWRAWFARGFAEYRDTGKGALAGRRTQITAVRDGGAAFPVELTITRLPVEDGWIFSCYMRDITEREWNERRRITRYAVTRILAESDSPDHAIPQVLEAVCHGLDWDWAGYWSREPGANEMNLCASWRRESIDAAALEEMSQQGGFTPGQGLLGRVWIRRQSAWIADVGTSVEYRRAPSALAADLRSTAALPVLGRSEVIGVIEFLSRKKREPDAEMLRLMDSLGSQIGQFIERRQIEDERLQLLAAEQAARAEAEAAERRLAFLAEASAQLSMSLDYTKTLSSVAHLALAKLADYCAIEMVDDDGRIVLWEIADVDPESEALGRYLHAKFPTAPESSHPVAEVIRTGQPILIPEVTDETLALFSNEPEYVEALRTMRIDSSMYVPLIARGRTMGAISFVAAESGYRYGPSDLALAQELARRAALAIDNARLYQEAQDAVRVREEFLSIASHELKTPLTTVKGYSQILSRLMRRPALDRSRLIRLTDQLQAQLGRFETLIADLLDVSRIQQGRLELRPEPADLVRLARTVLSRFESPAITGPQHHLQLDAPDALTAVLDPDRLDQVLTNLVSNAVKYSPDGGEIVVSIRGDDDTIEIAVADQGIGIPEAEHGQLFLPFSRSETVQRAISGVGLGLYISNQIVQRHGGMIQVESQPGKGSTFTVKLPRDILAGSQPDEGMA
jgi:PAS domain S-box-containing protein